MFLKLFNTFVHHKKILAFVFILLTALYFFQLFRVARNYSQSYRFGDEDAHIAGGYFILKGYTPYKDFSGNHQPLTYIFPAAVQKIAPANTLFPYVGRHRLAIFMYSVFWQVLYLIIFGKFMIFFALIFEISRYALLGNKILGEILAMYPLIYLFGVVIKKSIFNKKVSLFEVFLFSVSSFLSIFSLLPIWPAVFTLNLILFGEHLKEREKLLAQIIPFLFFSTLIFLFIPFNAYVRETLHDNITFVIPKMNKVASNLDYIKMILLPLSGLKKNSDFLNITVSIFLFVYLLIFYTAKQMKKIAILFVIIAALISTNSRDTSIEFGDFHVLPWLASYLFVAIVFFGYLLRTKTRRRFKRICIVGFISFIIVGVWVNFVHKADFYGRIFLDTKNNLFDEHYINYSRFVKYGLAIKSLKSKNDRLFGMPNDTLAFWVAGVDLATRPLESQRWQYELPRHKRELYEVFKNNPPEFVITENLAGLDQGDPLGLLIAYQLRDNYVNIKHLGKPSELYMLKSKMPHIKEKQWSDLKYYLFERPNIKEKG